MAPRAAGLTPTLSLDSARLRRVTASTTTALDARLAALRGPVPPRGMDARTLAALAANPGCRRRALLDAAGVDKGAIARHLGRPAPFGQSQFAIVRGNAFEARLRADRCAELLRLVTEHLGAGAPPPEEITLPGLDAPGPAGRAERTRQALAEATKAEQWALLDHPMLCLAVAGSPAYLEPDAVLVAPDGRWTVVEVKSFPILDGSADPEKVGAAARQAAVYVLALRVLADELGVGRPEHTVLLVCPRDFSNLPTGAAVDVRRQLAVTERQLARLTRIEQIAAELPEGTTFDLRPADDGTPTRPVDELAAAVDAVPARYAPDCLSVCELAFHCRARAREHGAVEALGRGVRGELGGLRTVDEVLDTAGGKGPAVPPGTGAPGGEKAGAGQGRATPAGSAPIDGAPVDNALAARLRRAARLRAEALAHSAAPVPGARGEGGPWA